MRGCGRRPQVGPRCRPCPSFSSGTVDAGPIGRRSGESDPSGAPAFPAMAKRKNEQFEVVQCPSSVWPLTLATSPADSSAMVLSRSSIGVRLSTIPEIERRARPSIRGPSRHRVAFPQGGKDAGAPRVEGEDERVARAHCGSRPARCRSVPGQAIAPAMVPICENFACRCVLHAVGLPASRTLKSEPCPLTRQRFRNACGDASEGAGRRAARGSHGGSLGCRSVVILNLVIVLRSGGAASRSRRSTRSDSTDDKDLGRREDVTGAFSESAGVLAKGSKKGRAKALPFLQCRLAARFETRTNYGLASPPSGG